MKQIKLYIVFFICTFPAYCQNSNSIWCFGDSAGIDFSNVSNPLTFASGMDGRGSCVSIADSNGNLLFYAYTMVLLGRTTILDANGDTMLNSDPIIGAGLYNELVIVPKPGNPNRYYLFSEGDPGSIDIFYYAEIDMTLNGGLGAVVTKNNAIGSFRAADCVQAVKHGNGRDWWVITKYSNINSTLYNRFYVYLVTANGISGPTIYNKGNATDADFQKMVFNSNGTKFMLINTLGFMCEYNFNRCTGNITNPNIIYPEQTLGYNRLFNEGAYSPNDSLFYASTFLYSGVPKRYILQYNLKAANIPLSCDTLDGRFIPKGVGAVRLAPDGKIYVTMAYEWGFPGFPYPDSVRNNVNENLSVINYPDSIGSACNYQPFSFYLGGKRTYYGLPNNPNYSLGPLVGSPCDTLGVGISETEVKNNAELFVFYHTGWQKLFVNAQHIKGKNCLLQIFDIDGRIVYSSSKKTQPPYFTQDIDMSIFSKGMFIVSLQTEKEKLVKKFVKD